MVLETITDDDSTVIERAPPSAMPSNASFSAEAIIDEVSPPDAATVPIQEAADFQARLNNLPPELYDMIKGHALSIHVPKSRLLFHFSQDSECCRYAEHLKILQLTQATRKSRAKDFFMCRTFIFESYGMLYSWLHSVSSQHHRLILYYYLFLPPGSLDHSMFSCTTDFVQKSIRYDLGYFEYLVREELRILDDPIENFDFEKDLA